ncbi:MAG: inositol monophosphatase family protein, partial [Sulfitobacter sp.]
DNAARLTQDTVFIVDPIDGTRSFVEGSKTWAHSVAVAHKGKITAAAIYLPMRNRLYSAGLGGGAYLNGDLIAVSHNADLQGADVLATKANMDPDLWRNGAPAFTRSHRPSLAYRLGLVAQGVFDAMLTFRPSWEWDIAAGALIVSEAGGLCTDKTGEPLMFNNPHPTLNGVVTGGAALHAEILGAMAPPPIA